MTKDASARATAGREKLAQRRRALGLTQEDLAELLKVNRSTVVRWERGKSEPLPWIQGELARALKVPADRLGELLAAGDPARPDGAVPPLVPRQLPAAVAGFTGRAGELETLTRVLEEASAGGQGTVVIAAVGGTAGVGKTALAVQWAHQVSGRFPGGQLYVNLRGYDPDRPVPAADALAGFLHALGVPGRDIPAGEDERAARFRSLLAGRDVLVILDNAGSAEQVRPLLPGSAGCAVVVTSRDSLAGLLAGYGAARLDVDLLPPAEAADLLRALIGQRAEEDPAAVAALAARCCRLPLALRVAAELAAARPDVPLGDLVAELADQSRRLDVLDAGGDPRTAVRAVFSWSYRQLAPAAARTFRLAGLHPGADFDPYAAAALTGTGLRETRLGLEALARAHLMQTSGSDRYGMHGLLRAYARELADETDGAEGQRAGVTRLFDHYLHTASMAMDSLYVAGRQRRPHILAPATPAPPVTEPAAARAWLDAERATLVAVAVHAAGNGWPAHATRLSAALFRYLNEGGHYPEAMTIHSCARAAAARSGDQAAEATALNCLGTVHWRQSRYQEAADHLRQALALFREIGDLSGEADALNSLGQVFLTTGEPASARTRYAAALNLAGRAGDGYEQARAHHGLGEAYCADGDPDQGRRHWQQALALFTELGTPEADQVREQLAASCAGRRAEQDTSR